MVQWMPQVAPTFWDCHEKKGTVVMPNKKKIETVLTIDRVTKGAARLVEAGVEPPLQLNIYLRKEQLADLGVPAEVGTQLDITLAPRKV